MAEEFRHIIDCLNGYAGLFSLLAVVSTIVVPIAIYRKNRKDNLQDAKDELDSMDEIEGRLPSNLQEQFIRRKTLSKKIKRK